MAEFAGRFDPIELSDPELECAGLRCMTFHSPALRGRGDVSFWVPPECAGSRSDVPLVLLLHGVYGSHWSWFLKGAAHLTARRLIEAKLIRPMVLVSPSDGLAGDGTAYLPAPTADYERWIVDDVPDCMREVLSCVSHNSLCLTGLSMGGYGALRLGMKWPQRFTAISAHSSITRIDQFSQFVRHPVPSGALAEGEADILHWAQRHHQHLPPTRFDCGREDDLFADNARLHAELDQLQVAHKFEVFDGGHTWPYWRTHLENSLLFFETVLRETDQSI